MYYCEHCHALSETQVCPYCGQSGLFAPRSDDYCYLTTRETCFAEMLEEVLRDQGIRFVSRPVRAAAHTIHMGSGGESHEIFVRYGQYDAACALTDELFSENTEDTEETGE